MHRAPRPSVLPPERIERAAIRHDGIVYDVPRPGRHHNVIWLMRSLGGFDARACSPHKQGFVTNTGRFVDRVHGLLIAQEAGQIIKKHPSFDELYSEDMW